MPEPKTILVVDDEPRIAQFIAMNLQLEGYRVLSAANGHEAVDKVTRSPELALVILDVMMPGLDGFETLRLIRKVSSVPVIFLSVRGEPVDRARGLDLGADDYMTKPFDPQELGSRVRAVLRRVEASAPPPRAEIVVDEGLTVNLAEGKALANGAEVKLRPTERRLLQQLITNPGQLLTHETLLARVWGPEYRDETQYLRLYITYLRQKLEPDPKNPRYILSERGLGYRFREF